MTDEEKKQLKDALDGIDKLKSKNSELLDKLAKVKKDNQSIADEKADAERLAKEQKLKDEGKLEELHKLKIEQKDDLIADLQGKLETANTSVSDNKATIRKMLVDDGLTKKFLESGVKNPALLKACTKLHSELAEVEEVDGKPVVKISGKDVEEYMKEWVEGDGKAFIDAGIGGGDAGSSSGGSAQGSEWEAFFKPGTINLTKQNELRNTDPDLYKQLKAKYPDVVNKYVAS